MKFLSQRVRRRYAVGALIVVALAGGTAWAVTTFNTANSINQILVRTNTAPFSTSSTTWVDVPGSATSVTVGPNDNALVRGRFSAESQCVNQEVGTPQGEGCLARIVFAGKEMNPKSGFDFFFDSLGDTPCCNKIGDGMEAHSMERISDLQTPGTFTAKVQVAVTRVEIGFTVDDWTFSLERMPIPQVPS